MEFDMEFAGFSNHSLGCISQGWRSRDFRRCESGTEHQPVNDDWLVDLVAIINLIALNQAWDIHQITPSGLRKGESTGISACLAGMARSKRDVGRAVNMLCELGEVHPLQQLESSKNHEVQQGQIRSVCQHCRSLTNMLWVSQSALRGNSKQHPSDRKYVCFIWVVRCYGYITTKKPILLQGWPTFSWNQLPWLILPTC